MPAYLDHAASTPMRPEAIAAMLPFLADAPGNPSGLHGAARVTKTALEEAREAVAAACGAAPDGVVFTGSGSEADNLAIKGAALAARERLGLDGVVSTGIEHKAVHGAVARLARDGFRTTVAPARADGTVDLDALAAALDARTAVVSVMLVNNETGIVQPLDEVADLVHTRAPQAVLHTDAVQAPQWLDLRVHTAPADLVALSGHKFGGPKGVGALVVRSGVPLVPLVEGGGHEQGRRAGTQNVAGIVAFATALTVTDANRATEVARTGALRDQLEAGLRARLGDLQVSGDPTRRVAGVLHLAFPGIDAETLLVALDQREVYAASGSACSSGAIDPSPVLLAMGMPVERARACVRFSLGYASTRDDIDLAIRAIVDATRSLVGVP
jgi:cysteine desulfurase